MMSIEEPTSSHSDATSSHSERSEESLKTGTENVEILHSVQDDKVPDVEMKIAKDIAKRSIFLFAPVALLLGVLRGPDAAIAVLFAGVVIVMNLFIAAEISRVCARISPSAIMGGALGGFVVRLAIIFILALVVKNLEIIDYKVWLLSVAIGHIALLAWETRYISFSLSHPGVKPSEK